jgi:hypothetical protein
MAAISFEKLANGNVVMTKGTEKYNLGRGLDVGLKTDDDHPDEVVILHPIFGKMFVDYNDVTVPSVASQSDLWDALVEDFFYES